MYGILDIGSNTIRLNVYSIDEDNNFKLLFNHKKSTGLASYKKDGRLTKRGINKAVEVLLEMSAIANNLSLNGLYAFATASLRNIENSQDALKEIKNRTGLNIDLISGSNEGRLSLKGALYKSQIEEGALFDVGGGSMEIVRFNCQEILESNSLEMGSLSAYLDYVYNILPTPTESCVINKKAMKKIKHSEISQSPAVSQAIGVGGTARAALKMYNYLYDMKNESQEMDTHLLKKMTKSLSEDHSLAREVILKSCADRVHTIIPGLCIILAITDRLSINTIKVSDYAIREGYLVSKVIEKIDDYSNDNMITI